MQRMLTVADILSLGLQYGLKVWNHYGEGPLPVGVAKPKRLTVIFNTVEPEAWKVLMTRLTEVDVMIYGTRQVHPSGSQDNRLFPKYLELLPEVNEMRARIGLAEVYA
jgi:hypothetical protein